MSGAGDERPFQVGDTVQIREKALRGEGPVRPVRPHQFGDVGIIARADPGSAVVYVLVPYKAPCTGNASDIDANTGAGFYFKYELDLLKPQHPE